MVSSMMHIYVVAFWWFYPYGRYISNWYKTSYKYLHNPTTTFRNSIRPYKIPIMCKKECSDYIYDTLNISYRHINTHTKTQIHTHIHTHIYTHTHIHNTYIIYTHTLTHTHTHIYKSPPRVMVFSLPQLERSGTSRALRAMASARMFSQRSFSQQDVFPGENTVEFNMDCEWENESYDKFSKWTVLMGKGAVQLNTLGQSVSMSSEQVIFQNLLYWNRWKWMVYPLVMFGAGHLFFRHPHFP